MNQLDLFDSIALEATAATDRPVPARPVPCAVIVGWHWNWSGGRYAHLEAVSRPAAMSTAGTMVALHSRGGPSDA